MNKLLLISIFFFTVIHCFSQQLIQTDTIILIKNQTTTWQTYFENDQVKIEYKSINCDPAMGYDFEQVNLRFTNKTSTKLDLDWHIHLYRDDVCKTCNFPMEYARTIRLIGNETKEGDCDRESMKELKLFSKFNDANYSKGAVLTAFKLAGFIITEVE